MADNGFTQINDIVLDIPPESIQVSRRSFNHEWQTLRTRSSIKVKSGFSALDITMTVKFTDDPFEVRAGKIFNGYRKLRNLVSQFRITPFCYIENQFLRNSILGGGIGQAMALALKQMEISKSDETTNTITVTLHFCWFNYFPFAKNFSFKRDIFVGDEVTDPRNSNAWRLMYLAEQHRVPYREVDRLSSSSRLSFTEFANIPVKNYAQLQEEVKIAEDIKARLLVSGANDIGDTSEHIREVVNAHLKDQEQSSAFIREFFGDQTTMTGSMDIDGPTETQVRNEILRLIDQNITSARYDIVLNSEWKPVVLKDNEVVRFRNEPAAKANDIEKFDRTDIVVLSRHRSIDLEDAGLITTGLTISFENILATLPMVGHPFPTYQHVGSIDARITLSLVTTNESSIQQLSTLYSTLEDQARKFRLIPQGQRTLKIDNDLVNMCGLRDTIPDTLVIETVQGSPGTYSALLVLANTPIDADTTEQLSQQGSFTTDTEIRLKLASILEQNLKLIDTPFQGEGQAIELRRRKPADVEFTSGGGFKGEGLRVGKILDPGEVAYYLYSGPKDDKRKAFRSIVEEYGQALGELLANIFPVVVDLKKNPKNDERAEDFFLLTNRDVFGIERIKEDIIDAITGVGPGNDFERLENNAAMAADIGRGPGAFSGAAFALTHQDTAGKAVRDRTQDFFIQYNNWRASRAFNEEAQASIVDDSLETFDSNSLTAFEDNDRIRLILNSYFKDWLTFSNRFLDKILYSDLVSLPEFEEVRVFLKERALKSSGGNYPDFPLQEVVGLLQSAQQGNLRHSFRRLNDLFEKSGNALKSYGLSSMLNPDFYFYNPQNDTKESIVSTEAMKTAAQGIIDSREKMIGAEKDWFKNVYEERILGPKKAALTKKVIEATRLTNQFKSFAATLVGGNYQTALDRSLDSTGLAPNELVGHVGPSIIEASKLSPPDKKYNEVTIKAYREADDGDTTDTSRKLGTFNVRTNYNDQTTFQLDDSAYAVRHRFDTEGCLSELPEVDYIPQSDHPDELPVLTWPIEGHRRTSPFNKNRVHPVLRQNPDKSVSPTTGSKDTRPKAIRPHNGIDLVPAAGNTVGTPVFAAADGMIISAKWNSDIFSLIKIQHNGGLVTWYMHLDSDGWTDDADADNSAPPRGTFRYWSNLIDRVGSFAGIDDVTRDNLLSVKRREQIGVIAPKPPVASGPHLHFETRLAGQPEDPERFFSGEIYKSKGPIKGLEPQNDSLLSKSVEQLEKDLHTGQGFSMMRAYPAFKLFFIESDAEGLERKVLGFDDFFAYSSVKEIQIVRSRKIAADLCMLQLTNISGRLSNRKFQSALDPTQAKDPSGQNVQEDPTAVQRANTASENPIASLMLQPGIQIQLRLGYSNNPDELETVFNGIITDVEFTETDDLVKITAQSYAVEMVQSIQGEVKGFGGFFDGDGRTFKILEELMAAPEVVHFGRWVRNEIGINNNRGLLTNRWRLVPTPQDDNIFPPMGQTSLGILDALVSTTEYKMYQTTIWDVFQEMTLRHPSYVACPVPYEGKFGNPRMTMFFGLPDQLYFSRDSSPGEDNVIERLREVVKTGFIDDAGAKAIDKLRDAGIELDSDDVEALLDEDLDKKTASERDRWFQLKYKQFAKNRGYIKPFRNYHILTSSMHILHNSISSSSHNTFNTVTVQYGESSAEEDEDTGSLNFGNAETFTLRADGAIPDEECREVFAQYPNCVGYEMAKQYAVALLYSSLKEAYKGSLVVIGSPRIKPYDICYIFDEYTDMFGPVEVEQVIHHFSQETGFITEITPDMVVHVNQHATLSTGDAMGLISEHAIKSIGMESLPALANNAIAAGALGVGTAAIAGSATAAAIVTGGAAVGALALANYALSPVAAMFFNADSNSLGQGNSTPLGMVGTFIFRKLITRTQLAHPFRFSPLVLNGLPMIGGLPNRRNDGTFIQRIGEWFKDSGEGISLLLDDTMDRMNPNNWAGQLGEGDLRTLFPGGG